MLRPSPVETGAIPVHRVDRLDQRCHPHLLLLSDPRLASLRRRPFLQRGQHQGYRLFQCREPRGSLPPSHRLLQSKEFQ